MKLNIVSQVINGEEQLVNAKGCEEIEFDMMDVGVVSANKSMRLIGIGKNLYKLTMKSYKQLKKELNRRGQSFLIN